MWWKSIYKCTAYKFVDRKVAKLLTEQIWKWIDFSSLYFCMKKQLTELQIPRYKYNIIEDMRDDHALYINTASKASSMIIILWQ